MKGLLMASTIWARCKTRTIGAGVEYVLEASMIGRIGLGTMAEPSPCSSSSGHPPSHTTTFPDEAENGGGNHHRIGTTAYRGAIASWLGNA